MSLSRQVFRSFLEGTPISARPLSGTEEEELFREGLLGIACSQRRLKHRYLEAVAREFRWRELLDELDAALAGARRQAIVFKGGAALGRLYPASGLRPVSDLDLLGDEHLPAILASLDFHPVEGQDWIWRRGPFQLDIHQHPLGRHQHAFPWDLRRARQQSEPLSQRRGLYRFQTEDETIIALLHAGKHAYSRIIWLLDIHLLLPRCQPERLHKILLEARATRYQVYADWLLARLSEKATPTLSGLEQRLLELCLRRSTSESLGMLLPLLSIDSHRQKLRYLWHCLKPQKGGWARRLGEIWSLARFFRRSSTPPASPP